MLVFPFHFRHRQQAVDQVFAAASECVLSCGLVFNDVSTLETARAIHRCEPTTEVTHQTQTATDDRSPHFAYSVWTSIEARQHFANLPAMVPLLVLDLFDLPALLGITD